MAKREEEIMEQPALGFASPMVGTVLTVAAALSFQFLCMVLPLVGKAGLVPEREYKVRDLLHLPGPHGFDSYVSQNKVAFLVVLFITLGLAVAATLSKVQRRKRDGSPFPRLSPLILALCLGLLVCHVTGLLRI